MKVLLTTLNAKYIHINLAIRLLYQLNKEYDGLEWREFTIKEDLDEIAAACCSYEVVAFSCYIWNITQTLTVAQKIKALHPSVKILLGGPEVSYDWEDVIARPEVDFIITGEGETPFQQFLEHYPNLTKVSNLIQKETTLPPSTAPMFPLANYADIMPYADDDPTTLRNRVLYIETSRGCPYKCEFCLASLDNKVRYLPTHRIKQDLLYMMQHGRVIKFLDRTFNIKRDFTLDIFRFILENYRPENVFQFEITADILHHEIIQFIQAHVPKGLFRFEIGIQTVNQRANLEVSRRQNFDKTRNIIRQLEDKVEMHLDLIVGLALDYWEDIKFSFEEVFRLFAPELQLGFLKFLKGTPVRDKFEQHGFVFDPHPPYQIIESHYLSREELQNIVSLEHALEIYWNKKRAIHTLKYVTAQYSIFDFLMGLGIYFGEHQSYYRYTLADIYQILRAFVAQSYPHDKILCEMITIDYSLHHKVKPKMLWESELDKAEKNRILLQQGLSIQQFRYVLIPISFDFSLFVTENKILPSSSYFIAQYTGNQYPKIISYPSTMDVV